MVEFLEVKIEESFDSSVVFWVIDAVAFESREVFSKVFDRILSRLSISVFEVGVAGRVEAELAFTWFFD